jgi:hypothetical protein
MQTMMLVREFPLNELFKILVNEEFRYGICLDVL